MSAKWVALLSLPACCLLELTVLGSTEFYVSSKGNNQNPGTIEKPFASLESARDAIRELRRSNAPPKDRITVWIRGGTYERAQTFTLEAQDSGVSEQQPVVYRTYEGETVHLSGGRSLGLWKQVDQQDALDRLPKEAWGQVLVADLKASGLGELPDFNPYGMWTENADKENLNGIWVYFKNTPMELACWPSDDYDSIKDIPKSSTGEFRGVLANKEGRFYVDAERAKRWAGEKDLWCRGFFAVTYADANQAVKSLDIASGLIELLPPHSSYGCTKGSLYKIANALSELDRPGEFKVDRQAGKVYFWPPSPIGQDDTAVPVLGAPLLEVRGAKNITFRGFTLELTRGSGVVIEGGSNVRLESCTIRNYGDWGVSIKDGFNHGVVGCDLSGGSSGGVRIKAGDRPALISCNHVVDNCHMHDLSRWNRTYHPAVKVDGVGVTVRNCLMHDLPHTAIAFSGNEHVFEFNEIHSVGYATSESGAIYTGRDWSYAGNHIRYNYFHDLYGPKLVYGGAIHLDDAVSGIAIHGNVFHNICWGIFHRGGRHIEVSNNVFVGCRRSAVDIQYVNDPNDRMVTILNRMPYKSLSWSTKYPQMANILENEPDYPVGSFYSNNICYGAHFIEWHAERQQMGRMKAVVPVGNNFWSVPGTLAIKRQKDSLQVPIPAEALRMAAGFAKLPVEQMGLRNDGLRVSWPVENELRALPKIWQAKKGAESPVCQVPRRKNAIEIDGIIDQKEWSDPGHHISWGEDPNETIRLEKSVSNGPATPSSIARIRYDEQYLYVGLSNPVDPRQPLKIGEIWGACDSVEVAIQDGQYPPGETAAVFVLRGYASGKFEADACGGASPEAITRLTKTVRYAAKIERPDQWSAEWRIPLSSLNIDLSGNRRIPCNLTTYKTASDLWVMWHGTESRSNEASRAGILELGK